MSGHSVEELERRMNEEWLPSWRVAHPGFDGPFRISSPIDEGIARSVLRALELRVVKPSGRGSFTLRGGHARAAIFRHGEQGPPPRRVLFAYEGLISVAAANDLYKKGWSPGKMAFEVLNEAFDLGVFDPRSNRLLIVCESKTKDADVAKLVSQIKRCGRRGQHEKATCPGSRTGHSKYAGLVAAQPELMWVVAPGVRRLFCPVYLGPGHVSLVETDDERVLRRPIVRGEEAMDGPTPNQVD